MSWYVMITKSEKVVVRKTKPKSMANYLNGYRADTKQQAIDFSKKLAKRGY